MKQVTIYTDGACLGNPGPGGWCCILTYNGREKIFSGGEKHTTNNRMELMSVIEGLKMLKEPCFAQIVSDSKYVVDAFNNKWIYSWINNNWKKSGGSPVKNRELWEELLKQCDNHKVSFKHIKGHSGHEYNERCDVEARKQAETLQSEQQDEVIETETLQ